MTKMLALFARAQAALRGLEDLDDRTLLFRLTIDAMPEPRRSLFLEVACHHFAGSFPSASELTTRVTEQYAKAVLDDLQAVGVIGSRKRAGTAVGMPPAEYFLSDETIARLHGSGLVESPILKLDYVGME